MNDDIDLADIEKMGIEFADRLSRLESIGQRLRTRSEELARLKTLQNDNLTITVTIYGSDYIISTEHSHVVTDLLVKIWTDKVRLAYEETELKIKAAGGLMLTVDTPPPDKKTG